MRQIAIVGLADSTHDKAPYKDSSWELWGLTLDHEKCFYFDKAFQMHPLSFINNTSFSSEDERSLRELDIPIYMQESYSEIPNAVAYPLEGVINLVGDYFNSSIAYMLGLAILENVDRIGIWGVDMIADDEFAYQRPNAEYLIGFAKGRGIDVFVPGESSLLTFGVGDQVLADDWSGRYGYYSIE
jgi:hypothetical protein